MSDHSADECMETEAKTTQNSEHNVEAVLEASKPKGLVKSDVQDQKSMEPQQTQISELASVLECCVVEESQGMKPPPSGKTDIVELSKVEEEEPSQKTDIVELSEPTQNEASAYGEIEDVSKETDIVLDSNATTEKPAEMTKFKGTSARFRNSPQLPQVQYQFIILIPKDIQNHWMRMKI